MALLSSRAPVRRRRLPSLAISALTVLALVGGACGGDDAGERPSDPETTTISLPDSLLPTSTTTPTDTTTTAPVPTGVAIDAFEVRAPLTCTRPSYDATVEWEARGVVVATVIVDGTQVAGPVPVEGPFVVTLPCDGVGHAVTLVAVGADDSTVIRTQAVLPGPQD